MHKLFRKRGNGFILFDRFWLYGFRRSWPFCTIAAYIGAGQWSIVRGSSDIDISLGMCRSGDQASNDYLSSKLDSSWATGSGG